MKWGFQFSDSALSLTSRNVYLQWQSKQAQKKLRCASFLTMVFCLLFVCVQLSLCNLLCGDLATCCCDVLFVLFVVLCMLGTCVPVS